MLFLTLMSVLIFLRAVSRGPLERLPGCNLTEAFRQPLGQVLGVIRDLSEPMLSTGLPFFK